jgi:hypothetical protein
MCIDVYMDAHGEVRALRCMKLPHARRHAGLRDALLARCRPARCKPLACLLALSCAHARVESKDNRGCSVARPVLQCVAVTEGGGAVQVLDGKSIDVCVLPRLLRCFIADGVGDARAASGKRLTRRPSSDEQEYIF